VQPVQKIKANAEKTLLKAETSTSIGIASKDERDKLLTDVRKTREKEFSVLSGRDTLIHACLCYGGHGAIAASANIAPRLCSDIYDKFIEGDLKGSLEAQFNLAPLRMAFSLGSFPSVIKEALQLIGIDAGPSKAPIGPLSSEERNKLHTILTDLSLI